MKPLKFLLLLTLGLAALLPAAYSQSILISSNTFSTSFGQRTVFSQAKFDFGVYGHYLFDSIDFGTQAVGETFTISSNQQDPNFSFNINALDHGTTNIFYYSLESASGFGPVPLVTESQLFPGLNGETPAQAGYQIQSFSLTIDSLSIQSPGSNPNGDGIWTDMSGQVSLMIYATPVPEPATLSLFGVGALLAAGAFRTRRGGRSHD